MTDSLEQRDIASLLHPITNLAAHADQGPLVIERGEGIHVWDNRGKKYIEGMAGLWCTALGYGEEELAKVAYDQMKNLSYASLFTSKSHPAAIALAEKLVDMAPFDASKVFFGNSGSDANDTQIKLVWYYNNAIGRPDKKKIIARTRGYHGVTIGSASLTGLPAQHKLFDLPLPRMLHTDCPHHYREARDGENELDFSARLADKLEKLIVDEGPDTVAAFIAEPLIGAGGVILPPEGYFEAIQPVLEKYDVLLIDDEVITGFGRTGNIWGAETFGMKPQTMSIAKALSSAYLPISAVIVPEFMFEACVSASRDLGVFGHGFTYSGHPVASAVALRTLEIYEERGLYDHAAAVSPAFQARLAELGDHPLVGEARGVGLVGAMELVANKETKQAFDPSAGVGIKCMALAHEQGLIPRAMGDAMALCPPLIVTEAEIDEIFDRMTAALDATHEWAMADGLLTA
jgi:4-aminobutyrate--pyruvate transaminase